jgi:hypothetical protein
VKINLPCLTLPWPRARPRSRSRRRAGMQRAQRCDGTPVAELYTSKGCSSSPRADRWLSKLTAQPEVVVLSDKSSAATTIPLPPGFANRLTEQIGANVVWVDGRNNDTYVAKASPRYYDHFVLRNGSPYRGVSEAALGLRLHLVQLEGLSCRGKAKVYSLTANGSLRSPFAFHPSLTAMQMEAANVDSRPVAALQTAHTASAPQSRRNCSALNPAAQLRMLHSHRCARRRSLPGGSAVARRLDARWRTPPVRR